MDNISEEINILLQSPNECIYDVSLQRKKSNRRHIIADILLVEGQGGKFVELVKEVIIYPASKDVVSVIDFNEEESNVTRDAVYPSAGHREYVFRYD